MTTAEAGKRKGALLKVVSERGLDSDTPEVMLSDANGVVHADLSVGTNVTNVHKLLANSSICHDGVKLHGAGFLITEAEAEVFGYLRREGIADHIRTYRNGRDLAARDRKSTRLNSSH